jgi:hypothetical protein
MIDVRISDGDGNGNSAGVTSDQALKVAIVESSANSIPIEQLLRRKQFRSYMVDDDEPPNNSLNVDGSSDPAEFYLKPGNNTTKWLNGIRLLFHGTDLELDTNDFRRFGPCTSVNTPLNNGVELFVIQSGIRTDIVAEPVTRMGEFLSYADGYVNLVNAVTVTEDFLSFDFYFDVPIILPPGTNDRLVCRINDDLTALSLFKIIARGYQELDTTIV